MKMVENILKTKTDRVVHSYIDIDVNIVVADAIYIGHATKQSN